jgi:hypothetical protein
MNLENWKMSQARIEERMRALPETTSFQVDELK